MSRAEVPVAGNKRTAKESLVLVAGADPRGWQLAQAALRGEFSISFAVDLGGTLDFLAHQEPALLLVVSDLLDASARQCIERVRKRSGVRVLVSAGVAGAAQGTELGALARFDDSEGATGLYQAVRELIGCHAAPIQSRVPARAAPEIAESGLRDLDAYRPMVLGSSPAIRRVVDMIRKVARPDVTILLSGETGTGKELFARRIHCLSRRARGPFRAVNLPAVPRELFESVLFGHERGSFTGAVSQASGAFEQAEGGTLFLDEVSSLEIAGQPKLLRAIQEKEFERVGARGPVACDVRIVAATNVDLEKSVQRREFREDLYHRLSTVVVELPPLRRRAQDIPLLVEFLVKKHAKDLGCPARTVGSDAMAALCRHEWTGNVRELDNRVQRALLMAERTELRPEDFFEDSDARAAGSGLRFGCCSYTLAEVEQAYIEEVLARNEGNQSQAARILGIDRKTLRLRRQRAEQSRPTLHSV